MELIEFSRRHSLGLFQDDDLTVGHHGILHAKISYRSRFDFRSVENMEIEFFFLFAEEIFETFDQLVDIISLLTVQKIDRSQLSRGYLSAERVVCYCWSCHKNSFEIKL